MTKDERTLASELKASNRGGAGSAVYSAHELAAMLGIHLNRVYIEAGRGSIPCLRFGRRFIFPRQAINAWLASAAGQVDAA